MRKLIPVLALLLFLPSPGLRAEEPVDLEMVTRIRAEGFRNSQVMDVVSHLTNEIGSRLTGSPQLHEANEWTKEKLAEWGLANAHLEPYPFGRGWSFSRSAVRMVAPREIQLVAYPKAWTPGTDGPVRGEAMRADLKSEKDFDKYRGKIAGKILFLDAIEALEDEDRPEFKRYDDKGLGEIAAFEIPEERGPGWRRGALERFKLRQALAEFLAAEKAVATVEASGRAHGIVRVTSGGFHDIEESPGVLALVMAREHYNQIVRRLDAGQPVEVEVDVATRFHEDDTRAFNTVAEIPGTDKKSEIVMAGAHLDSWHASTGATDNAAGVAVVMEAVRILKALGVKPRRTIRVALWTGEEQGLLGSVAYVKEHFATRPETTDPEQKKLPERYRDDTWPLKLKPEHAKLAAYFNLDNGTGKVRGIYTEENAGVKPIFEAWLAPFADLGATTVTLRKTGGTDHIPFDQVGLPGFQFIQDDIEYGSRTHHTNLDDYDHLRREDLMQASVVMASFLYHAAMRPEPLPRKPLPQEPPKPKEEPKKEEATTAAGGR
ncbi:MAG TPA: M20/M25/M40 family metallo-hydrolase [Thermoanaerobaculia bacterium]|nr:M20/M25/M40 family metallo-hydrolase [Thermoanaerobaculia bacterium]